MKRTTKTPAIIAASLLVLALYGCSSANAQQLDDARDAQAMQTFATVATDKPVPVVVIEHEAEPAAVAEPVDEGVQDDAEAPEDEQQAYEPEPEYIEDYNGSGTYYAEYSELYNTDGPSRTMPGWYDGYLETYYDASAHFMASEWTLDSDGYYHDSEGRYVIGVDVNDVNPETGEGYQYGDVVQTGKGEAVIYDFGQGAHVHDFAVSGW